MLLDPETQRAAAYTGTHLLITEMASPALLKYAQNPEWVVENFDAQKHAAGPSERRPLPAWATPEVQARLLLVRMPPKGAVSEEGWNLIPKK